MLQRGLDRDHHAALQRSIEHLERLEYQLQDGRIAGQRVIEEVFIPCDDVILAIGQENAFPWIERDLGIEFDKWRCRRSTR